MMVCASKLESRSYRKAINVHQSEESLDNGPVLALRHNHAESLGHNLVWLQSPSRNLRALYGNRSLFWEDGWYPGSSLT